jgi:hypothetical protein
VFFQEVTSGGVILGADTPVAKGDSFA